MELLSGSLLRIDSNRVMARGSLPDWDDLLSKGLPESKTSISLRSHRTITGSRWSTAIVRSDMPLSGEDPEVFEGPYEYSVWGRWTHLRIHGRDHLFWWLMSTSGKAASHLSKRVVDVGTVVPMMGVDAQVGTLVKMIASSDPESDADRISPDPLDMRPSSWILTSVHAKAPSFKGDLSSMSFYGGDLASVFLFKDSLPFMAATSVGIRQRAAEERKSEKRDKDGDKSKKHVPRRELASIGEKGNVTVFGSRRFDKVDIWLRFLTFHSIVDGGFGRG